MRNHAKVDKISLRFSIKSYMMIPVSKAITMKKVLFYLACIIPGMFVCSCTNDYVIDAVDFGDLPAYVEESGITNQTADSYTSWMRLGCDGYEDRTYEVSLPYATGIEQEMEPVIVSSAMRGYALSPSTDTDGDAILEERVEGNIVIKKIRMDYLLVFDGAKVPVSFVAERAFFRGKYGEQVFPWEEISFSLNDPVLTEMEDRYIGETCYKQYLVECRAVAENGRSSATAETSFIALVEQIPITFEVTVDDWKDGGDVPVDI